jgi:hypothetical protein
MLTLFENFATDKQTRHSYQKFYIEILENMKNDYGVLLELGVDRGGSCAAFKAALCNFKILGVDRRNVIDKQYEKDFEFLHGNLFTPPIINNIKKHSYNIIIDDMSHSISDMILAFNILSPNLATNGHYIIEDISLPSFSIPLILDNIKNKEQFIINHKDFSQEINGWGKFNNHDNHILHFKKKVYFFESNL